MEVNGCIKKLHMTAEKTAYFIFSLFVASVWMRLFYYFTKILLTTLTVISLITYQTYLNTVLAPNHAYVKDKIHLHYGYWMQPPASDQ